MVAKNQDKFAFEWKSSGHHIIFFVSNIIEWGGFFSLLSGDVNVSTPLHRLVVVTVVGHPVILLQTFIGQYTRRGCLFVGEMLPAAQGFGYTIIILTFIEFVILFSYASMAVEYLLIAVVNLSPPWMTCFKVFYKIFPNCFSISDFDLCPTASVSSKPCFEPGTRTLAPTIFKLLMFGKLRVPDEEDESWDFSDFSKSLVRHTGHVLIIYVLLLIVSMRQLKGINLVLRVGLLVSFVAFTLITVVVVIQVPLSAAFFSFFTQMTAESVTNPMAWRSALKTVIQGMMLAQAANFLFGSFIPASDPAPNRATQLTATYFFLTVMSSVNFHLYAEYIKYKMNMSTEMLDLKSEDSIIFVFAPMVVGSQASAYSFTVIYFLVLVVTSFNSLAAKVSVIEKSITLFFDIQEFYFHVRFAVCTVGVVCTYPVAMLNNEMELGFVDEEVYICSTIMVVLQLLIVYLYGFQRMCDDIEFFTHFRVSTFTQFCCLLTPVICLVDIWVEASAEKLHPVHSVIRTVTMASLSFPTIICLVYKVIVHSKKKNLIGIFRPTDEYGPPDIELRIFRILYNPRTLARYKGQVETCLHDCLLKSEAFKLAIREEIQLLEKFVTELEASPTDRVSCANIISQLKTHQVLLNKRLKHC